MQEPMHRQVLMLAGTTRQELESKVRGLHTFLMRGPGVEELRDVCHSALAEQVEEGRALGACRLGVNGGSAAALAEALGALLSAQATPRVWQGEGAAPRKGPVFIFSGLGSQWAGMGRGLLESEPIFHQALRECERYLVRAGLGWSVEAALHSEDLEQRLEEPRVYVPLLFACQVALAALVREGWGVEPAAVAGHSTGEIAAAVVAGALPLEQAARLSRQVAEVFSAAEGQGHLAVVELSAARARQELAAVGAEACVAIENSPRSCVLGGTPGAVRAAVSWLERQDVVCRWTKVRLPVHSPFFVPHAARLQQALESCGLEPRPARLPLYSAIAAAPLRGPELGPRYWADNFGGLVRLEACVERLLADGHETFVELSPHPVVAPAVEQILEHHGARGQVLASMRRNQEEAGAMHGLLAQLFCLGHAPSAHRLYGPRARRVELPAPQPLTGPAESRFPSPAEPPALERAALEALPHSRRLEALERFVRSHLAHLLRVPPTEVGLHTPLRDMGLDSLMLNRFRHALEVGLGQPLPMTLVWLFPTVAALAAQLLRQLALARAEPPVRQAPAAPVSSPASTGFKPVEVNTLTEAEAESLLLQTLDFIEVDHG